MTEPPAAGMTGLDADAARFLAPGEIMLCYACRPAGRCRAGVQSVAPSDRQGLVMRLVCPAEYEGGPQVAHGGWTALAFDEALGHIGPLNRAYTVTGRLEVDFIKPAPILAEVEIKAWVDEHEGRKWRLRGEMTLASTGAVLARASGLFIERRPTHFEDHKAWLEAQNR
jgi:acyl-coenzyme A thioesterase PaaI-like protein